MNAARAQEIIESSGKIGVRFQDSQVWLERVVEETQTAKIHNLETNQRMEVPLAGLFEDDSQEVL